ncbi:unnamed protein product, partial [Laminaria digitata]
MVSGRHKRCSHDTCATRVYLDTEGRKTAAYCKQHAEDVKVDILRNKRCTYYTCLKIACFSFEGSKTAVYCREHADEDMVNVYTKRCSYNSCTRNHYLNVSGSKTAAYCKQHAGHGMVHVYNKSCSYLYCRRRAYFNLQGIEAAAYCVRHAGVDMLNVYNDTSFTHTTCTTAPSFNKEGSKPAVYRKQDVDLALPKSATRTVHMISVQGHLPSVCRRQQGRSTLQATCLRQHGKRI